MKLRAILSRTTTDMIKSKVLSPELSQIVLDCYMTPSEFATILEDYFDQEFTITIDAQER